MTKKNYVLWIILLIMLVFNSGCQETVEELLTPTNTVTAGIHRSATDVPTDVSNDVRTYQTDDGITIGTNLNCSDRAAFGYIDEDVPMGGALVSDPTLIRWNYFAAEGAAPDWSNVCVPTSFTLYLSPGPDFNTSISIPITPTAPENLTHFLMYSYQLTNIQLHTFYRWIVVGHADGIDIDQDQLPLFQDASAWKVIDNTSQMSGQFQTGPACDPQTIGPVDLLSPQDEVVLDTDTPFFQWNMPNCASQAYWLKFDTDPLMANPDFGWSLSHAGFLMFAGHLQPCIIYNWQVEAGLYSANYHMQNGDYSSASEIRSFIIRSSACPNADTIPTSTPTLIPTATLVPTPVPPTPRPTNTQVPPTSIPISCSDYTEAESCKSHSDVCYWSQNPNGSFSCKEIP